MIKYSNILDVIVIAGGKATRLKKIHKKPKILVQLNKNYTLLEELIKNLKANNINTASILSGKNGKLIQNFINKKKIKNFKLKVIHEDKLLGTAGCLKNLNQKKLRENVLIIYGDLLFNININKFFRNYIKNKSDISIFSHPSDHLMDSDIIDVNNKDLVKKIYFKPHKKNLLCNNLTMSGIFLVKKKLLKHIPINRKTDFSKHFLKKMLKKNYKITSFRSREYCRDLGTPTRLKNVRLDFKQKKNNFLSINKKIPAIFIDRDGVINKDMGPKKYSNPLNFLKDSIKGLKLLRKTKYLIFLITNQGAIAKGFISYKEVENSFKKYELYLSNKNFYFDKIYFCPHHPAKGFPNENKKYKVICSCRKPKPGLIFKAKKEFNIDLNKSYFIGDSLSDYRAAKNAGVKIIMTKKLENKNYIFKNNLFNAAKFITSL